MTTVTSLELAVIRNIVTNNKGHNIKTVTKSIVNGIEPINKNQVNAVVLNLIHKKLLIKESTSEVQLTPEGFELYKTKFPEQTTTVNGTKVHSVEELTFMNQCIELRNEVVRTLRRLNKAFAVL